MVLVRWRMDGWMDLLMQGTFLGVMVIGNLGLGDCSQDHSTEHVEI